jgi:hypothetical protein
MPETVGLACSCGEHVTYDDGEQVDGRLVAFVNGHVGRTGHRITAEVGYHSGPSHLPGERPDRPWPEKGP